MPMPAVQKPRRCSAGSVWPVLVAVDSSMVSWAATYLRQPVGVQQGVELHAVDAVAHAQQRGGAHRGDAGPAARHHADERELRAAAEQQQAQRHGLPEIQSRGDGQRAEGNPVQPGGDADGDSHPHRRGRQKLHEPPAGQPSSAGSRPTGSAAPAAANGRVHFALGRCTVRAIGAASASTWPARNTREQCRDAGGRDRPRRRDQEADGGARLQQAAQLPPIPRGSSRRAAPGAAVARLRRRSPVSRHRIVRDHLVEEPGSRKCFMALVSSSALMAAAERVWVARPGPVKWHGIHSTTAPRRP